MRDGPQAPSTSLATDAIRARRLSLGFGLLALLTLGLIVLGALVRAHGAGLSCPDWPLCFGRLVPQMNLEIAFEWTHRLVAGCVSLSFATLALACLRHPDTRRVTAAHLAVAALLLAVQILLGALTVWKLLASWTVTAHLLTGNAFAVTLLWTALRLREASGTARPAAPTSAPARAAVSLVGALLILQMALGGRVSSTFAGLACPEWPACNGGIWFPSFRGNVGLHLLHRLGAYTLVAALLGVAWGYRRDPILGGIFRRALWIALAQVAVGVANVRLGLPVEVTALHSALACALLLTVSVAVREVWLRPAPRLSSRLGELADAR